MICRHEKYKVIDALHKECTSCGVWKGIRSDAHHYSKEYFYDTPGFPYFRNGIPQRSEVFAQYVYNCNKIGLDISSRVEYKYALEIGPGVGFLAYSLFHNGWDVDIIEEADWNVKYMLESYGEHERFHIFKSNYEYFGGAFRSYDLIYNNHVLEHLENPMRCIEEWYSLLNNNGSLVITVPDKNQELNFHHTHNWAFDVDVLYTWFQQSGFVNVTHTILELPANIAGCHILIRGDKND